MNTSRARRVLSLREERLWRYIGDALHRLLPKICQASSAASPTTRPRAITLRSGSSPISPACSTSPPTRCSATGQGPQGQLFLSSRLERRLKQIERRSPKLKQQLLSTIDSFIAPEQPLNSRAPADQGNENAVESRPAISLLLQRWEEVLRFRKI